MGASISMAISQNSQSIADNSSNVTVSVTVHWSGGSHNHVGCWLGVTVDGQYYGATVKINPSKTSSGSEVIYSESFDISHNSDGTKKLECSADLETGISSGTVYASASKTLTTIARTSTLSAQSGSLGTKQTLTINRASSSLTHTITYSCGSSSGTIATKTSNSSVSWTPPVKLAEANPNGGSVTVKLTLTTYSGSTAVGTHSISVSYSIPASLAPTFTVSFSDAAGYKDTYGDYIQLKSKLKIVVNPTTMYGATIKSCKITANGETFTGVDAITSELVSAGNIQISVSVTDSRNKTAQDNFSVSVLAYSLPIVSKLAVKRCNSDGTVNDQGEYVQVTFSASATTLDGENTVSYKLQYKKTSEYSFTTVNLTQYNNVFSISDKTYTFSADTGSSYDVELIVTDAFGPVPRSTIASTAATIMHFKANGRGIGFGKVSEVDNAVDVGWDVNMNEHHIKNVADPEEDGDGVNKRYADSVITKIYPVGAIYISTASTSPASVFGGTWERIQDRFLLAAGSSYTAGATGGSATHTLTVAQIPSHDHGPAGDAWAYTMMDQVSTTYQATDSGVDPYSWVKGYSKTGATGGGAAHNNMPPYLAVYIWKRTA